MIRQPKDYIHIQKKKFLLWTFVWAVLTALMFVGGIVLTKTRNNYFTLVAGLLILPLALNFSRLVSFLRFKDGRREDAELLERMKGSYVIFHSAIIPDTRATVFFEHSVVTARNMYFLTTQKDTLTKHKAWLMNRLVAKGLSEKELHFVYVPETNTLKNMANKIEKDACYTSENLEKNAHILQSMLM